MARKTAVSISAQELDYGEEVKTVKTGRSAQWIVLTYECQQAETYSSCELQLSLAQVKLTALKRGR